MLKKIWATYEKHERRISSVGLVLGFIFDNLTLSRTDYAHDMNVFFVYLGLLGIAIALLNLLEGGYFRAEFWKKSHTALMFIVQLLIGGLFSGFVVIYGRSASFLSSWFFLLILAGLLIGNEFIKKHYARMTLHMSIYFMAIFSFMIFLLPVMIGRIADWIFVLSAVLALAAFAGFICLLSRFVPERIEKDKRQLLYAVGGIVIGINALYFLNVIPPIPLALKTAEAYHSIARQDSGDYAVTKESQPWYSFLEAFERVHIVAGERVYVESSVFAPVAFKTDIVHEWRHFDDAKNAWVLVSSIQFPVTGGRDSGFRGYSYKDNLMAGLWRVDIKTPNGQKLGSAKFMIVEVPSEPALVSETI